MIAKNCDGKVPESGALTKDDEALIASADALIDQARTAIDKQELHSVLTSIWAVVADANRYFASQEPWALKKTDPARMATVLWVTAETIRKIAILVQPVMPESAGKLLDALSVPNDARQFAHLGADNRLQAGTDLPKPTPIFPRYVEEEAGQTTGAGGTGKGA
jgi:methionyl-tRNA synthetase